MTTRTPREIRLRTLYAIRRTLEDEILLLENAERLRAAFQPKRRPRSRHTIPDCGSETAYQRHAHNGDTATDKRRVTCRPCLAAHADHERAAAAVRRAMQRLSEAS